MNAGELYQKPGCFSSVLIIRPIDFPEMCRRYDDLMLEYDLDDLWSAYEKRGTPWEVLDEGGKLGILWPSKINDWTLVATNKEEVL